MFRRELSLIIITSHTLARVDLSGRRQLHITGCWQRPMLDAASPAALVATALKLASHKAKRVWILNSELATTQISLPLEVSVLLADGELEHALAFEAEGQTGIAATSSRIGYAPMPTSTAGVDNDTDHYWVTQIAESEMDAMRSAARGLGAELVAVAHPDCAAYQPGASGGELRSGSDSIDDLANQWASILSNCGHRQCTPLLGAIYAETALTVPNQMALQLAACLLTASCLGAWAWHRNTSVVRLASDIAAHEQKSSEIESITGQIKLVDTRIARLSDEVAKVTQHQNELRRKLELTDQTARLFQSNWSHLLDALCLSASDDCWIQSWRVEKEQVLVDGLSIGQTEVHRFVGRLDQQLRDTCWTVLPANTAQTDHDLVSFTIAIQMQAAPTLSPGVEPTTAVVSRSMEQRAR